MAQTLTIEQMTAALQEMARRADASYVIVSATVVEDLLEQAILVRMRFLSNSAYARIFTGYGPLATFSAKIDIAYALTIIDKQSAADAHAVRELRNAFAHSKIALHFNSPELAPILQKLRGWKRGGDMLALFNARVADLMKALNTHIENSIFVSALSGETKPKPSRKKS